MEKKYITKKNRQDLIDFLNECRETGQYKEYSFSTRIYVMAGTCGITLVKVVDKNKAYEKGINNWRKYDNDTIIDYLNNLFWNSYI